MRLLAALLGACVAAVSSSAEPPQLLFSDLTSAPKTGWSADQPERGAAVTIWGRHFGDSRGDSHIRVNGVALDQDSDYAEWSAATDVPSLRRITFWLRSSCQDGPGTIVATVDGIATEPLPFAIRPGRIYFVDRDNPGAGSGTLEDPWQRLAGRGVGLRALRAGDILYIRESAEPYDQVYLTGRQTAYISGLAEGTREAPIAVVGFPAEQPELRSPGSGMNGCIQAREPWWTFAKLRLRATGSALIAYGQGVRVVGNDCEGCRIFGTGTGILVTYRCQHRVFGNAAHGATTENKLDHAIYVSGNASVPEGDPDQLGVDLGWNYTWNNRIAIGPHVVVNHQENRIPRSAHCARHELHDNLVDCSAASGRGIGIYSMSYDLDQGELPPEPALVYNNVVIAAGGESAAAMYISNGAAKFFNNTLIGCRGRGFAAGGVDLLEAVFANNVVLMSADPKAEYFYRAGDTSNVRLRGNVWYGLVGSAPSEDTAAVTADPMLAADHVPAAGSPAAGCALEEWRPVRDFLGRDRGRPHSIGALEAR